MKSFLLLILSLMTGFEASDDVKVCTQGWVQFTCNYPEPNKNYQLDKLVIPNREAITSFQNNVWVKKDRFLLYHDTQNKSLRVTIKPIEHNDIGKYKCQFLKRPGGGSKKMKKEFEKEKQCPEPVTRTAYRTAKTTITCDHGKRKPNIFCKETDFTCEDILSTKSSPKQNGKFSLTQTTRGFNVSISKVSSQHAGVYWCGFESTDRTYRVSLTKVQVNVKDIKLLTQYSTIGQNFTYWCNYQTGTDVHLLQKFFCKGENPYKCQPITKTGMRNVLNSRFSINDDTKGNISITLKRVTSGDSGTYWCGATTKTGRKQFIHKLSLNVVLPTTPSIIPSTSEHSPVTSSFPSTPSTTAMSQDGSQLTAVVAAAVCVVLLILVVILIFVYKRFECSNNNTNGEASNKEAVYEEIQESTPKSDTGTSVRTVYVTAIFPTNPSAFMDYSKVNFQNCSGEVTGEIYSTVLDSSQHPTYSTVNHPSGVYEQY